jgi:hypothetical protein
MDRAVCPLPDLYSHPLTRSDLFYYGANRFSKEEFAEAGITEDDIEYIKFMGAQEVGHARLISNLQLNGGRPAAEQCEYRYYFESPREFVNFCQRLTRWYVFCPILVEVC